MYIINYTIRLHANIMLIKTYNFFFFKFSLVNLNQPVIYVRYMKNV